MIVKMKTMALKIVHISTSLFICFSRELGVGLYKSEEVGYLLRILAPLIPFMYLDREQ